MGVGGDDSWGATVHPQYRLTKKKYEYSFRIRPITKDDDVKAGKREVLRSLRGFKGVEGGLIFFNLFNLLFNALQPFFDSVLFCI